MFPVWLTNKDPSGRTYSSKDAPTCGSPLTSELARRWALACAACPDACSLGADLSAQDMLVTPDGRRLRSRCRIDTQFFGCRPKRPDERRVVRLARADSCCVVNRASAVAERANLFDAEVAAAVVSDVAQLLALV